MIEDGNILKASHSWHLKRCGGLFTAGRWWSSKINFDFPLDISENWRFRVFKNRIFSGACQTWRYLCWWRVIWKGVFQVKGPCCLTLHINKYTFTQCTYTNHCWKSFLNVLFKILQRIVININTYHLRIPGHNKESTFVKAEYELLNRKHKQPSASY